LSLKAGVLGARAAERFGKEIEPLADGDKITERLKMMNRVLLKKLRPVALGRVGLAALVEDLIAELQRRYPEVTISHSIRTRGATYGEAIDLAIYRSIQEGVTNAIRHGKADTVRVELYERRRVRRGEDAAASPTLQLIIQDDGRGILPETKLGFGLTVMRERINALGGSCAIQSVPSQGATLRAVIPIKAWHAEQQRPLERIEAT
jgi:two-component system sensor histidine kinase UhpB